MAKSLSRKRAEDYDSDDGFVEDAPKSKKQKGEAQQKKTVSGETQTDDDGNPYWEVSGHRYR